MKTREEILESIKKWYALGAEDVKIREDKETGCIMLHTRMWTNFSQEAIAGSNQYTVFVTSDGVYPNPHHVLEVVIYY